MTGQGEYQARNSQLDRGAHRRFCGLAEAFGRGGGVRRAAPDTLQQQSHGWRSTLTYRELWRGAVWNFALGMLVSVVPALAFYYLAFDYRPAQLRRLTWLGISGIVKRGFGWLVFQVLTLWR